MKVYVDRSRCVGAGQCVRMAPAVFDQDELQGLVVLLHPDPPRASAEQVRRAALLCPAQAIRLDDQ
jgi:ferredoxin